MVIATFRPKETSDGILEALIVDCYFQHNHLLGATENIGTMGLSETIKKKIKVLYMRGMPIRAIMDHLTMLLREWHLQLKARMDLLSDKPYFPKVVVTDQGQNEINTI
ncbi:hypothetical protein FBU30_004655 [Linnemannia zychae]|nr:hypothetical protein FBU30_004655 [Linnemannia zychae]